jgi:hypothetical protein
MDDNITNGTGQGGNRPSFTDMESIDFVKVKRNKVSNEPYLFFCPNDNRTTYLHTDFTRYYKYLACNSGFGKFKKAIFYKFNSERVERIDIRNIEPINILYELKKIILEQLRNPEDPTFCNTIYNAVEEELQRKQQNR